VIKKRLLYFIGLFGLLLLLTACPQTEPPIVEREPIIPETTKVPDQATRDALTVFNVDTGEMRFNASTPILDNLKAGDVFVSEPSVAAPYGFLRKVSSVTKDGGEVVVATSEAKLTDAIHQGTLNVQDQLQQSQLKQVTPLMEGAFGGLAEGSVQSSGELEPQISFGKGFDFEYGVDAKLNLDGSGDGVSATGTANFSGRVKFNVGYRVLIDIGFLADLDAFEASLGFEESVNIKVDAKVKGKVKKEWEVARFDFDSIVFFIGPVPVVLVPSAKLKLGLDGDANFDFDYTFGQIAAFRQGVRWDEDKGWSRIDQNDFKVTHEGPNFKGKLNLTAYAKVNMRVLLYSIAGPDVGAAVGLRLDVAYPRDPLWRLFGLVVGDIAFTLEFFGEEERFATELFRFEREIASGAASPPVITVLNPNPTVGLRAAIDLEQLFKIEDQIGVSGRSVRSDRDGEITDTTRAVFTTPGQRVITVSATSQSGKSAEASFNLDIINTPPKLSDFTVPTTIGAGVDWAPDAAATAFDPNEAQNRLDCSRLTWTTSSNAPLSTETSSNRGCQPFVVFTQEGTTQQVTVTATDSEGATDTKTFDIQVTQRPANIPPGVRFVRLIDGGGKNYQAGEIVPVFNTVTASVEVSNPDNKPLEYQWLLVGFFNDLGYNVGSSATATVRLSDQQRVGVCAEDGDNNPQTCKASFVVRVSSIGVLIKSVTFPFVIDFTVNPN
jgi:hypothetical protein